MIVIKVEEELHDSDGVVLDPRQFTLLHTTQPIDVTVCVCEQFLNGTSAQLSYTMPFTSVHAGKYTTEDKSRTDTT